MPQFYRFMKDELPPQSTANVDVLHTRDLLILKAREFVVIPEHQTEDYHVCLVPSTPPPLTINRKDCCYNRKNAIVMPPNLLIRCKYHIPTKDYFQVTLSRSRFNEILRCISPQTRVTKNFSFPYSSVLFSYAQALYSELEVKYPGYELMAQSKLTEFIIQLIRESRVCEHQEKSLGKNYNYTDRALEFIHTYYNADISLDDLCKELALSRYHFIRIFKNHTHTTPHAYLMEVRLEHAMEYLGKKDYSLEEIAVHCGFLSQAHFSQSFKKKFGMTPTQYRSR